MTNRAYIVANEQQEREVLKKLEQEGYVWVSGGEKPTEWSPSRWGNDGYFFFKFPYALVLNNGLSWTSYITEDNYDIVFDGRKEEQMSEKYVVSQEFMDELEEWKDNLKMNGKHSVYDYDIHEFSDIIEDWWSPVGIRDYEQNKRLIAILRWVNGEDVFEIEKPKKWVVRSKELNANGDNHYGVLAHFGDLAEMNYFSYDVYNATKFDTKEEAESWANAHQEVVEVVDV